MSEGHDYIVYTLTHKKKKKEIAKVQIKKNHEGLHHLMYITVNTLYPNYNPEELNRAFFKYTVKYNAMQHCSKSLLYCSLSLYNNLCGSGSTDMNLIRNQNFIPLGAISLFATSSAEYQDHINAMVVSANQVYHDFLKSESGTGFTGQVNIAATVKLR